jgi:glycosyltransferase involved in cell wall biosynthesis
VIGINYIADAPIPSRAANCVQVLQMSSALARAGADVTLYAPWSSERLSGASGERRLIEEFALERPVPIRYLPHASVAGRLFGSYFPVSALAARWSRRRVVMTRNARIGALAAELGLDVILESHTPPSSARLGKALNRLVRSPRLLLWVFISERLRELLAGQLRSDTPHVVLHDAVDLERFQPALGRAEARARLGLSAQGPVVVHAGSLYPGRGAEELVGVLPELPPGTELWFVGGRAADIARVQRRVPSACAARVRFFGHQRVRALPGFLFAADALVLASTSRGTANDGTNHVDYSSPMKLFEYFAAGRPIVATALRGVREVTRDSDNALLAPLDDPPALAPALTRALTDAPLAARLSAGALASAAQHTWLARAQAVLRRLG